MCKDRQIERTNLKNNIMNHNKLKFLALIFIAFNAFISCEDEGNETMISRLNGNESHNSGSNCMTCHKSGGKGSGWFTLAGTVYDSALLSIYPNAEIMLYNEYNESGTAIKIIQADALGNFYTTENIDFSNGLYVAVKGKTDTIFMDSKIVNGQCGSCHGISTDNIWIK